MDVPARYRWIAANILPYEAELRGWLRRRLGALGDNDVDDLVQEAFARIWAADFATIRSGRAYLYATVRHLLAEYARRSRIVPIELLGEIDSLNLISEEPGPERLGSARRRRRFESGRTARTRYLACRGFAASWRVCARAGAMGRSGSPCGVA